MAEQEKGGVDETRAPEDIRGAISAALKEGEAAGGHSAEVGDDRQSSDISAKREPATISNRETVQSKGRKPSTLSPPSQVKSTEGLQDQSARDPARSRQSAPQNAVTAPSEWRASQKELFKSLPEAAQQFLTERHRAMEADYNRKTEAIADIKRDHDAIDPVRTLSAGDGRAWHNAPEDDRVLGGHRAAAGTRGWRQRN
jgi:hypothetical protein